MRKMMNRLEAGKDIASLAAKSRFWVLLSYFGIIALLIANGFLLVKEGAPLNVIAILALMPTLPLLLFAPGIWLRRPRSHAWICFVSLLYFMHGVDQAFLPNNQLVGIGLSVLSMILFVAAMMFSRWESLRIKALNPQPDAALSPETESPAGKANQK